MSTELSLVERQKGEAQVFNNYCGRRRRHHRGNGDCTKEGNGSGKFHREKPKPKIVNEIEKTARLMSRYLGAEAAGRMGKSDCVIAESEDNDCHGVDPGEFLNNNEDLPRSSGPFLDYRILNYDKVASESATLDYIDKLKEKVKKERYKTLRQPSFYPASDLPQYIKEFERQKIFTRAKRLLQLNELVMADIANNGEGLDVHFHKQRKPIVTSLTASIERRLKMGDKRFARGPIHSRQKNLNNPNAKLTEKNKTDLSEEPAILQPNQTDSAQQTEIKLGGCNKSPYCNPDSGPISKEGNEFPFLHILKSGSAFHSMTPDVKAGCEVS